MNQLNMDSINPESMIYAIADLEAKGASDCLYSSLEVALGFSMTYLDVARKIRDTIDELVLNGLVRRKSVSKLKTGQEPRAGARVNYFLTEMGLSSFERIYGHPPSPEFFARQNT